MQGLTSTQLARALGVSAGRVSQYVAEGKVDGCYTGAGRDRRFDVAKVAARLGKVLDQGQMLGNGAGTRQALDAIRMTGTVAPVPPVGKAQGPGAGNGPLSPEDPDAYQLARTQKTQEELRRLRRLNELDAGTLVLASEVERQVAQMLAREVAETEQMMRDAARALADQMGLDFKAVRKVLLDAWRAYRARRSAVLQDEAEGAAMADTESAADF